MRESIGGFTLFNIVIVFIIIFASYISLSINYSKAYNVKNEILNIIRNQGGVCTSEYPSSNNNCYNFSEQITDYFNEANYRSSGTCDDGWVGYDRNGLVNNSNSAICIIAVKADSASELPNAVYYKVKVFYSLDVPIFSTFLGGLSIEGETGLVYDPNECKYMSGGYNWCS